VRHKSMRELKKDQVYTGLRLGLGMVAGVCTMSILAYGFAKLRFPEVDNSLLTFLRSYPPRLVGVICIVIALAILISTIDMWAKMLAGLFAYAAFGGLLAVFAGGFHSPIASLELDRLGAGVITALLGTCALLTMRLGRDRLTWADRAAALSSPLSLMWAGTSNTATTGFEVLAALVVVFAAAAAYDHVRDQSAVR
jgi:tryptophan-rich sensory protein